MTSCPCGGGEAADCCEPYLTGLRLPTTPEALMRSRYSAFSTGEVQYLLDTQRLDGVSREQLEASVASTRWLGLSVLHSSSAGDEGEVEFIARYKDAQGLGQLHERSRFRREQGRWLYVGGRHLPPPKPQRNDPCWCGSGKKLKKCCGA